MAGRVVVLAVLALAAVAAADAVRGDGSSRVVAGLPAPRVALDLAPPAAGFEAVADGRLTRTRVLRNGKEILGAEQIHTAFPGPFEEGGIFDVADVAVAPDGTLALAVYEFPPAGSTRSGIELWKGRRLLSAFEVAPGAFAGGIAFTNDGTLVAAFDPGGRGVAAYDRNGRRKIFVTLH